MCIWPFATPWTIAHQAPGSSVYGILQERILKWVAIPFSRGSSWPNDQTWVSCIAGRFFTVWATRRTHAGLDLLIRESLGLWAVSPFQFIPGRRKEVWIWPVFCILIATNGALKRLSRHSCNQISSFSSSLDLWAVQYLSNEQFLFFSLRLSEVYVFLLCKI